MPTYYSQHGEDYILAQLFANQEKGYFLEIGALDGIRFSNTYFFEQLGWSGITVEAHPDFIEILRTNRPKSICVHAAVGNEDGTITFYANKRGSLSTLNTELKERFAKDYATYFHGYDEVVVPSMTTTNILKQNQAPQVIDVVSIDVEGWELQVLQGLDFSQYQPRVFVVEALDDTFETSLTQYMQSVGYLNARNYHGNIFFCHSPQDAELIKNIDVNCVLVHKPHPIDIDAKETTVTIRHSKLVTPAKPLVTRLIHRTKRIIKKLMKRVSVATTKPQPQRQLNQTLEVGFHGDKYLIELVHQLLPQAKNVIETGTNVGTTAWYIARHYPNLPIYSCEPDDNAFNHSAKLLKEYAWVKLYNQLSPQFLYDLYQEHPSLKEELNFFWLDAHSYGYRWPLHDEIAFVSATHENGIIAIDDTKVPDFPQFQYTVDNDQICDRDYIVNALTKGKTYRILYPNYTEHTSPHHPLTGVVFVLMGDAVTPDLSHFRQEVLSL